MSPSSYTPFPGVSSQDADENEWWLRREISLIQNLLDEEGEMDKSDIGNRLGCRYWGPLRFSAGPYWRPRSMCERPGRRGPRPFRARTSGGGGGRRPRRRSASSPAAAVTSPRAATTMKDKPTELAASPPSRTISSPVARSTTHPTSAALNAFSPNGPCPEPESPDGRCRGSPTRTP